MSESEKKSETREEQPPKAAPFGKVDMPNFNAWQLAWELGYTIAIPIVLFALIGRWGDRMLGTTPWLLLGGVLFSVVISSIIVYRKVSRILNQ